MLSAQRQGFSMAEPGITRRFDLYLIHAAGIVLRHKDEGIEIGPNGISYMRRGTRVSQALANIAKVILRSATVPRQGTSYICRIEFRDGTHVDATTVNTWGTADTARKPTFRDFVATLHRALLESGAAQSIAFQTGYGAARSNILLAALIAGAAFFIVVPLAIFITTGQGKGLFLCLAGAVLVLPALRMAARNRPGTYQPENPPDITQ